MLAFTTSVEPLRAANRMSGETLYTWHIYSVDGEVVKASNGVGITPDCSLSQVKDIDVIFVCAGLRTQNYTDNKMNRYIRALARHGVAMGAVSTGTIILADAGLLEGYRCAIHWEYSEGFEELFPNHNLTSRTYEIDRNRYTCSGGTAPLDMMIHSIALDHSSALASKVADQMLYGLDHKRQERQRSPLKTRINITHTKILAAIRYMESHTETPVPTAQLAKIVGLSLRQFERLFKKHMQTTPARYYLELRLTRASQLVKQTKLTLLEIAVSTGFSSPSHFSRVYTQQFGHAPSIDR
ncbi:MAG: GlxA family transcriptional regulator [Robiginitomaculum sp.]|nr:GlxA family transcriptional regulator [Robiginitomaculum sp.]